MIETQNSSEPEVGIHKRASLLANSSPKDEVVEVGRGRGPGAGAQRVCSGRGWDWQVLDGAMSLGGIRWLSEEDIRLSVAHLCLTCISLILSFSDLQDPIVCLASHPHGPPFYSSSNSIPVAPQATILSQVSSTFSFAEPLDQPPVTQSPPSPTGVIHLPSPQPSTPIASSAATDMPLQSGTLSSPIPQTDLSHTLPPVKSSLPSPTTSAPVNVITTSTPPDKTGKYEEPSCSNVCGNSGYLKCSCQPAKSRYL